MATVAYIGLGSNLGDREAHLVNAINAVKQLGDLIAVSSIYESEPFGIGDEEQPKYLNMAAAISTEMTPSNLLCELMKIERENGRVRYRRFDARTLDLDILIYGEEMIATPELTIPHPRMTQRAFVMKPLSEIAADLVTPGQSLTVSQIANRLEDQGVRRIGQLQPTSPVMSKGEL